MIRPDESLAYHEADRPGKIELRTTKSCLTAREMRLAYLPGACFPGAAIHADPDAAFRYTARGNLVGVITNGSAVPGLGDVGPLAAKPMQEGTAVLFKRLADIDVFDLELDTGDPDRFVDTVQMLEPTFGGIDLKDIKAPEGLEIYARLCEAPSHPRRAREPPEHGGRDGGRAPQRARSRGEDDCRRGHRDLRRGHGRHRLRAIPARHGRDGRTAPALRRQRPRASRSAGHRTCISGPSHARTRRARSRTGCGAPTCSSGRPPAACSRSR